jgi:hypothetical protein
MDALVGQTVCSSCKQNLTYTEIKLGLKLCKECTKDKTAVEIYEIITGNKRPKHVYTHHAWMIDYLQWLEEQIVYLYNIPNHLKEE